MKKYVILSLLISLLFVTGCDKKTEENPDKATNDNKVGSLVCSKTITDEDGNPEEETMTISYKNDIVTKVVNKNTAEMDESLIDVTLAFGELIAGVLNEVNGFEMKYTKESNTKISAIITVDYEKLDLEDLKAQYGSDFDEDSFYSSKNISLETFKKENLEGFECK